MEGGPGPRLWSSLLLPNERRGCSVALWQRGVMNHSRRVEMGRPILLVLCGVLVACAGQGAHCPTLQIHQGSGTEPAAAQGSGTEPAANSPASLGLDADLSGFAYPYPVKVRNFEAQGQPLVQAYMDVQPETVGAGGQRPTLLLLHGKNFSGAYWADTIAALTAEGYRVVVPDQVGFGKSSKPRRFQWSFQELATHTAGLLDALGIENVVVVGHSMGGMLATRFALMYAERVERLVLVNPIGFEDWKRTVPYQSVDAWYQAELKKTPEKIKAYMVASYFDGQWQASYEPLLALQAGWAQGPDWELLAWVSANTYDMIFTQPVLYEFVDLTMPVLLVIGQRDRTALGKPLVAAEVAAEMGRYDRLDEQVAEAIPHATLVELEGVGHIPQFEAFDAYMAALKQFLAE